MKVSKNKVTLLGAAVAALFATAASAQIVLPAAGASSGSRVYASELISPATLVNAGGVLNVTTQLGIGMSSGQTRYLRVRMTNATFATAVVAGALVNGTTAFATTTIAIGGAAASSEVIFQVTGAGTGNQIADALTVTMPNIIAASTATAATVSYEVYEFLTQAQAGTSVLYARSSSIARFSPAVQFRTTAAAAALSTTATAITSYFNVSGGTGFSLATRAVVGDLELRTPTYTLNPALTVAPFLADSVTAATIGAVVNNAGVNTLSIAGDFSAAASAASVALANANAEAASAVTGTSASITLLAATIAPATGFTNVLARYTVNGTTALPVSAYVTSFTGAAQAGYVLSTLSAGTTGNIVRDGVQYESPWVTATPGFISRFFLTQTTPATVPYTVTVRNFAGVVTGGTLTGTLVGGRLTLVTLASLLPADTTAVPGPYQVTFNIAASNTVTQGTYVLTSPNGAVANVPLYRASEQ